MSLEEYFSSEMYRAKDELCGIINKDTIKSLDLHHAPAKCTTPSQKCTTVLLKCTTKTENAPHFSSLCTQELSFY